MNIFALHEDPVIAAQMHCDSHVVKMVLETAQMLCNVMYGLGYDRPDDIPYRKTHENHPCSLWAKRSRKNFEWLAQLGLALADEFVWRYEKYSHHASRGVIMWCAQNAPHEDRFPLTYRTRFQLAMPNEIKTDNSNDPVRAYREYYQSKANDMEMTWRKRPVPTWFKPNEFRSEFEWSPGPDQEPLSDIPFEEYIKRVTA